MRNPFKPIAISLIPNYSFSDVVRSFWLFLQPWAYLDFQAEGRLVGKISLFLGRKHVILCESGRAAEYFLLKALGIGPGDEVIIQAFTCVAVPNSIIWNGARPVYCDIDESLNLDPKKLEKLITLKTKAVIFQATFGAMGKIREIREICRQHKVLLIEDLAHGLGNESKTEKLGNFGGAAYLSFGRDKVISGIWGGAVVTDDDGLYERLQALTESLPERGRWWVAKQLVFAPLVYLILQTYAFFNLGKALHRTLWLAGILPKVLDLAEKEGERREVFHRGMPGALARLAESQLTDLGKMIGHRKRLADYYDGALRGVAGVKFPGGEGSSFLRYSILVSDPQGLRRFAARRNVFLGDWYDNVVAPKGVSLEKAGYRLGSCSQAEEMTGKIVNLPTGVNVDLVDAERVVNVISLWLKHKD
ncbi:hypothetical protein A2721_00360 [Candidatus Gottesmanbacteria bacterium RIFCSPHIGHO2_01_FULL_47_48]|uniref:Aminotransferase class I/classII domain-containing protein n=1 Tax=Candidatus Gottesmanbacteria bacterium RIFCSPHIGHO2_01_FULL_47_48 TaxID=1798381 RepID=A0A1F6A172_9BACT|nr:MAG: hypothetical protein A2721_00360 [Candidatus Gottesmanbacteria bacterium RIFCSPHIGHO2_01_FULL_47_48]